MNLEPVPFNKSLFYNHKAPTASSSDSLRSSVALYIPNIYNSAMEKLFRNQLTIPYFVGKDKEGLYLTVPFTMPANIESFTLTYEYERRPKSPLPWKTASSLPPRKLIPSTWD